MYSEFRREWSNDCDFTVWSFCSTDVYTNAWIRCSGLKSSNSKYHVCGFNCFVGNIIGRCNPNVQDEKTWILYLYRTKCIACDRDYYKSCSIFRYQKFSLLFDKSRINYWIQHQSKTSTLQIKIYTLMSSNMKKEKSTKKYSIAVILSWIFWVRGIQHLYLRRRGMGIFDLGLTLWGIFLIGFTPYIWVGITFLAIR